VAQHSSCRSTRVPCRYCKAGAYAARHEDEVSGVSAAYGDSGRAVPEQLDKFSQGLQSLGRVPAAGLAHFAPVVAGLNASWLRLARCSSDRQSTPMEIIVKVNAAGTALYTNM
jgi:hypothetical protein